MKTSHIADLFCGAGGTSTGALQACAELGLRARLTAVDHWPRAIATHTANHPESRHLCQSLDTINPRDHFRLGELDLLWGSPECMSHSVARGGRPVNDQSRATAWCVTRWAEALQPRVILVENVPEFLDWGPIGCDGKQMASRKGATFRAWVGSLESLGYRVDHRILCAANYGDPTSRRRLFVQAVRGRRQIRWPEPTHFDVRGGQDDFFGCAPWRVAREVINWKHATQSIFSRKRPLSANTLRRIEIGLRRFGLRPFLVPQQSWHVTRSLDRPLPTVTGNSTGEMLCEPFIQRVGHYGRQGNGLSALDDPLTTVTTKQEHALVEPFLVNIRGTSSVNSIEAPLPTVTAGGTHLGLCEPFLTKFYGSGAGAVSLDEPLGTVTVRDRFGLVQPRLQIDGEDYLLDVHFRMLQPDELAAAQGFPADYQFTGNKSEITKQIGNAVPCGLAHALVKAALKQ